MTSCAGPICPRCHKGHLTHLSLSDEWEKRLTAKWGHGLCEPCKKAIMIGKIKDGLALPWDLPGHEHTNANYDIEQ